MNRIAVKFAIAALLATVAIPSFAQVTKEKEKDKEVKDKQKYVEQIIITTNGDSKEKTIVEINGDKITVNGKPIEDLKEGDVKVYRNKFKTFDGLNNTYSLSRDGQTWNYNSDHDNSFGIFGTTNENRAMLGVVTEEVEGGVKVTEITDESAAKKAGIKEGDIITKIGETKIDDPDKLTSAIRKHKPGEKVDVTLLRDKKEQKVTAELGKWKGVLTPGFPSQNFKMDMPEYRDLVAPRVQTTPRSAWGYSSGTPKLGLSVQDTDDGKGVKVIDVDDESNAAKAGLKENDIVTHFNDKEVNSADEVAKLVRENKDKPTFSLKIKRDGKAQSIEVKVPRKLKTADL